MKIIDDKHSQCGPRPDTCRGSQKSDTNLELYYKPGYYRYGVAMFHQVHCLARNFLDFRRRGAASQFPRAA